MVVGVVRENQELEAELRQQINKTTMRCGAVRYGAVRCGCGAVRCGRGCGCGCGCGAVPDCGCDVMRRCDADDNALITRGRTSQQGQNESMGGAKDCVQQRSKECQSTNPPATRCEVEKNKRFQKDERTSREGEDRLWVYACMYVCMYVYVMYGLGWTVCTYCLSLCVSSCLPVCLFVCLSVRSTRYGVQNQPQ